ncbi:MAG: adenylyl-sulfate kinase [Alphaproteobacteria bacterium]|nr:adenylyl-sulfate kinase [Alphaproteobacteria bacterium]
MVIWITGLSGAGKTTLATALYEAMKPALPTLVRVDGDEVRALFGNSLGFAESDRRLQIQRLQSLATMLDDQGLTVIVAALYAHPELLAWNRDHFSGYFEVYLEASLELVRSRDPKGLYAKADSGDMAHVVGVDVPWHAPDNPHMTVTAGDDLDTDAVVRDIMERLPSLGGTGK